MEQYQTQETAIVHRHVWVERRGTDLRRPQLCTGMSQVTIEGDRPQETAIVHRHVTGDHGEVPRLGVTTDPRRPLSKEAHEMHRHE
jgi:hypothetical protein